MTDTANTSTPSEQQPAPPKRKKTPVARLCPVRLGRIDRFRRRDRLAGRYGIGFAFRFVQNPVMVRRQNLFGYAEGHAD